MAFKFLTNGANLFTGAEALPLVPKQFRFQPLPAKNPAGMGGIGETITYLLEGKPTEPRALARALRYGTRGSGAWAVVAIAEEAGEQGLDRACNEAMAVLMKRLAASEERGAQ